MFTRTTSIFTVLTMLANFQAFANDNIEYTQTQPNQKITYQVQPNVGLGAGDNDAAEGFADLLVPIYGTDDSIVFVNPRFSLLENEIEEGSIGIGYRKLFENKGVLGTNIYLDIQDGDSGNSYKKYGVGLEWLGNVIDVRGNWYGSNDSNRVVNEYQENERTVERDTRTISQNTTVNQSSTPLSQETIEVSRGEITPRENRISQDVTLENIQNTLVTTEQITRTVRETTTTLTDTTRYFEQLESVKEGWDAEIGAKLPNKTGPETRVFIGHFHYDEPFKTNDTSGTKARLEMRFSNNITLDIEGYDQKIDDTSYFVGLRYAVPISNPSIRRSSDVTEANRHRTLRQRMATEMVQRDWRVRTDISDPIENEAKREVEVTTESERFTETSTQTTEEEISVSLGQTTIEEDVLYDRITWVDSDSAVPADGTYENPYTSVGEAADNAGVNNTIFVCEAGGGVCDLQGGGGIYDEQSLDHGVNLQSGQILTSSIVLSNGDTFETMDRPVITNTIAQNGPSGVISAIDTDNIVINRLDIREGSPNRLSAGINAFNAGNLTITNNLISSAGDESDALRVQDHIGGDVLISNNTFNVFSERNTEAILLNRAGNADATFTVEANTINFSGSQGSGILTSNVAGEVIISDNAITIDGDATSRSWGWRDFRGQDITFQRNNINANGLVYGIHTRFSGDSSIDGASGNAQINILSNNVATGDGTTFTDTDAILIDSSRDNVTFDIVGNTLTTQKDNADGVVERNSSADTTLVLDRNIFSTTGTGGVEFLQE